MSITVSPDCSNIQPVQTTAKVISYNDHFPSNLMSDIVASDNSEKAFNNVYKTRLENTANSDLWSLSHHWKIIRPQLQDFLLTREYQLSPLSSYTTPYGVTRIHFWFGHSASKKLVNLYDCCHIIRVSSFVVMLIYKNFYKKNLHFEYQKSKFAFDTC